MKENAEQTIRIARMFYEENMSKTEIARKENISRNYVAHILRNALKTGLVEIRIGQKYEKTEYLELWVKSYFGLDSCRIVLAGQDGSRMEEILLNEAAGFLKCGKEENIWIGIDEKELTGRLVQKYLEETPEITVKFVSLTGTKGDTTCEFKRSSPRGRESVCICLPCPLEVATEEDRRIYRRSSMMQEIVGIWEKVSMALVSADDSAGISFSHHSRLEYLKQMNLLLENPDKSVGYFLGRSINIRGEVLDNKRNRRVLAIAPEQFKNIHHVVAIACGMEQLYSIAGLLNTGLVTDLYIDDKTAEALVSTVSMYRGSEEATHHNRSTDI